MIEFADILYGSVTIPDWLAPFVKAPEFLRLRGVRLSNVDSYQFKDFGGPSRWEHGIAVAALARRCATKRGLSERDSVHLILAALLHDVATPPFAHTAEYVLSDFDHEVQSQRLIAGIPGEDFQPDLPVFASQLPQFGKLCDSLSSKIGFKIDRDEVARMIVGEGDLGFLIHGTLDLDNADNVIRAGMHVGINVDRMLPLRITDWLAQQPHIPTDLGKRAEREVADWLHFKHCLYEQFYKSTDEELGRQAFLQHLMRRAIRAGLPRRSLIWNTDYGLLDTIEELAAKERLVEGEAIAELVQRYRLMDAPIRLIRIDLDDASVVRVIRSPQVVEWVESELSQKGLEAMVMVSVRRYELPHASTLFPLPLASLLIYKLNQGVSRESLPPWLLSNIPPHLTGQKLQESMAAGVRRQLPHWVLEKPWLTLTREKKDHTKALLDGIGDWSFRLSRNENMHAYPSTFVHAIPASLINALNVRNELIIDTFGGTGQTAVEAIKYGGSAVSADNSTIACLVARAKLTYLPLPARTSLRSITAQDIKKQSAKGVPTFELANKWFHEKTLAELAQIRQFIRTRPVIERDFLNACFSAVIPYASARKGEQHGYFADNCPLPKGEESPPYTDASALFVVKIHRNLHTVESLYAFLEREGREPQAELSRAKVLQLDCTTAEPSDYGLQPRSAAAVITSPPYLCMSDYTLGQRLSYYWLAPDNLSADFDRELGARRQRSRPEDALERYLKGMKAFVSQCAKLIRPGGYLATILGAPVAKSFKDADVLEKIDRIVSDNGFTLIWDHWRRISWHRNHGYERLKRERIAVYVAN
jgi:HD superfamily phosphohydrolase